MPALLASTSSSCQHRVSLLEAGSVRRNSSKNYTSSNAMSGTMLFLKESIENWHTWSFSCKAVSKYLSLMWHCVGLTPDLILERASVVILAALSGGFNKIIREREDCKRPFCFGCPITIRLSHVPTAKSHLGILNKCSFLSLKSLVSFSVFVTYFLFLWLFIYMSDLLYQIILLKCHLTVAAFHDFRMLTHAPSLLSLFLCLFAS